MPRSGGVGYAGTPLPYLTHPWQKKARSNRSAYPFFVDIHAESFHNICAVILDANIRTIREVRQVESGELVIHVPKEFKNRKVEVIISPSEKESEKKFSKEIEDFLKLGGSGCWEGDLDEMRESRDGFRQYWETF